MSLPDESCFAGPTVNVKAQWIYCTRFDEDMKLLAVDPEPELQKILQHESSLKRLARATGSVFHPNVGQGSGWFSSPGVFRTCSHCVNFEKLQEKGSVGPDGFKVSTKSTVPLGHEWQTVQASLSASPQGYHLSADYAKLHSSTAVGDYYDVVTDQLLRGDGKTPVPEVDTKTQLVPENIRCGSAEEQHLLDAHDKELQSWCGEVVALLGYAGQPTEQKLFELWRALGAEEQKVVAKPLSVDTATAIFRPGCKILSVGRITKVENGVIYASCPAYHGMSGGPLVLFRDNYEPRVIGYLIGGLTSINANRCYSLVYAELALRQYPKLEVPRGVAPFSGPRLNASPPHTPPRTPPCAPLRTPCELAALLTSLQDHF